MVNVECKDSGKGWGQAVLGAPRDKGKACPIRSPGWITIIPFSFGELLRFPACNIDKKEVLPSFVDKANTIEPVPKSIDNTHFRQWFAIFGFFICRADLRIKYQPFTIG